MWGWLWETVWLWQYTVKARWRLHRATCSECGLVNWELEPWPDRVCPSESCLFQAWAAAW